MYQTNTKGTVPPLVTTQFTTEDQGKTLSRQMSLNYNRDVDWIDLDWGHLKDDLDMTRDEG